MKRRLAAAVLISALFLMLMLSFSGCEGKDFFRFPWQNGDEGDGKNTGGQEEQPGNEAPGNDPTTPDQPADPPLNDPAGGDPETDW